MKKIRVIEYSDRWLAGGTEAYITKLVCRLDAEKLDIGILAAQKETELFDAQLIQKNGQKICVYSLMETNEKNPIIRVIKTVPLLREYLLMNPCDVLHLHIIQGASLLYAKIAKQCGVKQVIAHCHNSKFGEGHYIIKWLSHQYGKHAYRKYIDTRLACSDKAAKWLFVKSDLKLVSQVKYLVDVDRFRYSSIDRLRLRNEFKLSNEVVYLTVGRMDYQKNPEFLLHLFLRLSQMNSSCRLFWIGMGEKRDAIYQLAKELGLSQRIHFIDSTLEVEKYMSMSDFFLLPSLYEGNPIVVTEAQSSGLPCILSDAITKNAQILDSTKFISLEKSSEFWATTINQLERTTESERIKAAEQVRKAGYSSSLQIHDMEKIYCNGN